MDETGGRRVDLEHMHPIITEKLSSGGEVIFTSAGTSMLPTLRDREDQVCIVRPPKRLRKYDLPFYNRDSGQYVLHRIAKVNADGTYTLRGDHQFVNEEGVRSDQIIGVVKGFWRGGRYIPCDNPWYRLYCRIWWLLYPVRYVVLRGRGAVFRLRRRFH